ncbi:hypothetical protein [Neorhizobium galegae]|uniref:hypothetical protein n=1 Tax=Neorhizobium galegae TaxID=399 RepID=UPI0006213FE1|nr:hypothetical protein [Neorhizobium galegae]CDZ27692.1 Hypothetical protein NGAL_HAMBI490_25390 [Neorhizobium galegae bv. officinalis]KAA9386687.1 hypothetical protein F4V88_09480 [Neorhizobium galegae]KAB1109494.1 hypothetical protein F4V89_27550 [Neorhizobium galegae]MCM2501487.1 hypothetical protein [Neorhizobium galegae]MCQ1772437.1 hypothetical protein [Neorhizobium galegae]
MRFVPDGERSRREGMMLDLGLSLIGPGTFSAGGGKPPEEDGFTLMDAEGNALADAENNRLTINQRTISRFIGLED